MRIANREAASLTIEHATDGFVPAEDADLQVIHRILPTTGQTYAAAIKALRTQEKGLIEFYGRALPNLSIADGLDERAQAEYIRNQIEDASRSYELTYENLQYIEENTSPDFTAFRMSEAVIKRLLNRLCTVNNKNGIFRLVEGPKLRNFSDMDPRFVNTILQDLTRALKIAAEADRIESVEAIFNLAGRKIRGSALGEAEHVALQKGSRNAFKALQRHAASISMDCCERFGYRYNRKKTRNDLIVVMICTIILVGALAAMFGTAQRKNDKSDP